MRQSSRMSPERVGFALGSTGPSESQDQSKGLFPAGPEFDQHWFATPSDEAAEDEGDDDRIVELPSHWDEVRDKVERQSEIPQQGRPATACAALGTRGSRARRVTSTMQSGIQRGKCPRVRASAPDHEPGEERAVYDEDPRRARSGAMPTTARADATGLAKLGHPVVLPPTPSLPSGRAWRGGSGRRCDLI